MFNKNKKLPLIKTAFESLLKIPTVPLLIKHYLTLPSLLPLFTPVNPKSEEHKYRIPEDPLLKVVLDKIKCTWTEIKKMSWKHTFDMLRMIPALHQYFPINEYNEYFLEEVFVILKSGNGQTKPVAATALCDLLWQNHHSSKRNGILAKVLLLAQSTSYYERISFMWFCVSAFQRFSQNAIKAQGLVSALLKLANDRVSNTRIRFLEITKNLIIYMKEATQKEIIDKVKELQDDKNKYQA